MMEHQTEMTMTYRALLAVATLTMMSACATRPPLDRSSFRTDGTGVRGESQTNAAVRPPSERLNSPALVTAAIRSAEAQMATNEYATAADLYGRAYATNSDVATLVSMSRALRLAGQAQTAVLTLQAERGRHGTKQPYLVELGRAALAGGYLSEANEALTAATARSDAGWAAHVTMGVYKARSGDNAAARASFERAVAVATEERDRDAARANIAMLTAQSGDVSGAIAMLEPLAARPAAHRRTVATLAVLYGMTGQRGKYLETARRSGLTAQEIETGSRWLDITSQAETVSVSPGSGGAAASRQRRSANQTP